MAFSMHRAFNHKMQSAILVTVYAAGSYDDDNVWTPGASSSYTVYGVITAGNKFSQFEEGIALHAEDGGARYSNYRNLYIKDNFIIPMDCRLTFRGYVYRVLQESDEEVFGFNSFILEREEPV